MRLKQLLGLMVALLVTSAVAVAATSQLTNISVSAQTDATLITLRASSTFTHQEYRPTDTLLLVDLSGVSPGKWNEKARALEMPGVSAYHVLGYTDSSGKEVARVEFAVAPAAVVDVVEGAYTLVLTVAPDAASAARLRAERPAVAAVASKPANLPGAVPAGISSPATISEVSISRSADGLDIQISTSAPISPRTMKLTTPDRIVVDLPNAVPRRRAKTIQVDAGDVKTVRVAQFQSSPPVTRLVVDLAAPHDFELVPAERKLVLKLRNSGASGGVASDATPEPITLVPPAMPPSFKILPVKAAPVVAGKPQVPTLLASVKPGSVAVPPGPARNPEATGPAKDLVIVNPQYRQKPKGANLDAKAAATAAARVLASNPVVEQTQLAPEASGAPQEQAATDTQQASSPSAADSMPQPGTATVSGPPKPKYTGEPISVNLKDVDLKDFFRLIHEISGLNIVLDPAVKGTLTLVLDDVPWDQALDIVLQNNGLDRKLQGNVLRIATVDTMRKEADAIRAKNEAEALSVPKVTVTHFLSYAKAADVVPTVKKFLSQRGDVIADGRTNAVIIQDIPSVLPPIQSLLSQLDRKTTEVEIEARVVAATRSFARDIGFQLGFGWGNGPSTVGGVPGQKNLVSPIGNQGSPNTTSKTPLIPFPPYNLVKETTAIPLFSALGAVAPTSGLNFHNVTSSYRIDAILSMAEDRGLLKILSRPRVVTQNNKEALVRQGVRVPIVTAAQLGGPPTTSYVDAFLRLTVTPQITSERTIFLNLDVENTTPDFGRTVAGNPTLITQQATTSVLVSDGGTVVIGGVIQTNNAINIRQVPLLGNIPALGNLFKNRSVSTSTQELLFFVTPKIVQT